MKITTVAKSQSHFKTIAGNEKNYISSALPDDVTPQTAGFLE